MSTGDRSATARLASATRSKVRRGVRAAAFLSATVGLLSIYEVRASLASVAQRERLLRRYRQAWLDTLLRIFHVELRVVGASATSKARSRIIVANHRSALDIPILLSLFECQFLSRADIASWPLLGHIARLGGTIFVDRENASSRAGAARAIRRRLLSGGTVVVFPEGTTFEGDEVRPFHSGAFAGVGDADVEILPVGLAYPPGTEFVEDTFVEHLAATAGRARLPVAVSIGQAYRPTGTARKVGDEAHDRVQREVTRARQALDASP